MDCLMNVDTVKDILKKDGRLSNEQEVILDAYKKDTEKQKSECKARFQAGESLMCELKEAVVEVNSQISDIKISQAKMQVTVDDTRQEVADIKSIIKKMANKKSLIEHVKESKTLATIVIIFMLGMFATMGGVAVKEWKEIVGISVSQ